MLINEENPRYYVITANGIRTSFSQGEYYHGDKPFSLVVEVSLGEVYHDYYQIKPLLEDLPISVLPIAKEVISSIKENNLKELLERTIVDTYQERFISSKDKIIILGFESLKKKAKVYRTTSCHTINDFYSNYALKKEFVMSHIDELFDYIIAILTDKKDNMFLPIRTPKTWGSYKSFRSRKEFVERILIEDERIASLVGLYMESKDINKEEPFKSVSKRLIYSPNQVKNIIRKGI